MRKLILVGLALALALSVAPAMAADDGPPSGTQPAAFQALSKLPTLEKVAPIPMTDEQLAAIEGGLDINVCIICLNIAVVTQVNTCTTCAAAGGVAIVQLNSTTIKQKIN